MGNPWLEFMAEQRSKPENAGVSPIILTSRAKPLYKDWLESKDIAKPTDVEVDVKNEGKVKIKSNKKKGKMGNPWLEFMAEQRAKPENTGVSPIELTSRVKSQYKGWLESRDTTKMGVKTKKNNGKMKNRKSRNKSKKNTKG
jgi:hypothetical protein